MHLPATHLISAAQMQGMISQALGKGFTGYAKAMFESESEVGLLVFMGEVREVLLREQGQKLRLPGERWKEHFSPLKTGNFQLCKSPGRMLSMERACFEGRPCEIRPNVPSGELEQVFSALDNHESATLVTVEWPQAQARVLLSGGRLNIRRGIFIKNFQIAEDDPGLAVIKGQQNVRCNLEIYRGELANDPWIVLHLSILFEFFCAHLLRQYGYLTGKVMVNSILNHVTIHAAQQDWDMSVVNGNITEHTFFASIEEAVAAYIECLTLIEAQMKSIIGEKFLSLVKTQSADSLNVFYKRLNNLYGLNHP